MPFLAYARLVGERFPRETRREFAARTRIVSAMTQAPHMVAGTGRTRRTSCGSSAGDCLEKEGAEGVYAIGLPRAFGQALPNTGSSGIALKIEDGAQRGRDAVSVEVMRQLGLVSGVRLATLRRFAKLRVQNARGDVVGGMKPVFALELFASGERPD